VRARLCLLALLAVFLPHAFALEQPTSEYTSTKTGKMVRQSTDRNPIDFFEMHCKGLGGYELIFLGADARSWINVKYGRAVADLRNATFELSPGTFPNKANDVVEWRGVKRGGEFVPYALIYRLEGGNDETRKLKSRLIVIRLNKGESAVVGYAEGKDEDAEAKRIADRFAPK
jgi:hypothetical protein